MKKNEHQNLFSDCRQPFGSKDIRIDRFLKQLMQKIENQILAEKIDRSLNKSYEKEFLVSKQIHEREISCYKAKISQLQNEVSEIKLAYTTELEKQLNKKKIMQENENVKKKNVKLQNDLQVMRDRLTKIAAHEIENKKLKKELIDIKTKLSDSEAEKVHLKKSQNERIRLLERKYVEFLKSKDDDIFNLRSMTKDLEIRNTKLSFENEKLQKNREDERDLLKGTSGDNKKKC